jgi:hypothetical protein
MSKEQYTKESQMRLNPCDDENDVEDYFYENQWDRQQEQQIIEHIVTNNYGVDEWE